MPIQIHPVASTARVIGTFSSIRVNLLRRKSRKRIGSLFARAQWIASGSLQRCWSLLQHGIRPGFKNLGWRCWSFSIWSLEDVWKILVSQALKPGTRRCQSRGCKDPALLLCLDTLSSWGWSCAIWSDQAVQQVWWTCLFQWPYSIAWWSRVTREKKLVRNVAGIECSSTNSKAIAIRRVKKGRTSLWWRCLSNAYLEATACGCILPENLWILWARSFCHFILSLEVFTIGL